MAEEPLRDTEMRCRSCASTDGVTVLDLGEQAPWDRMPLQGTPLPDATFPLRMWLCAACGLAQLEVDADVEEELVAVELRAMAEQNDSSVARLAADGIVRPGGSLVEYGSPHGDTWLARVAARGMEALPAEGVAPGTADVVADLYGLLHAPDQESALRDRAAMLAPGGTLALQLLPLETLLRESQWYDLRHGHYAYWSIPALETALRRYGLGVHRVHWFPLSGGTVLVVANADPEPDEQALAWIRDDAGLGVTDPASLHRLQVAADDIARLGNWLVAERAAGRTVAAYGAASRSVPLVCHAQLSAELLTAVGDASPAKQGHRMPGTDIPIVTPDELVALEPDRVVLFLESLADEVRDQLPQIEESGGRWVIPVAGTEPVRELPVRVGA
ncbi:class I SAM-dependent methyltransferase [Pseudonocardia phyllosphaerae]|uniref:class I SAM-dependent methyltransferase n=1 Tax=Pseudonocardia phyllosphaerae TaxID=3390502 RepID=UPI0039786B7C